MHAFRILVSIALVMCSPSTFAATCSADDYELKVSGASQCLLMRRFGASDPDVMLVWLHGDVSAGGPGNYHFPSAEQAVSQFAAMKVLSVALVRPGYPDGSGDSSSVAILQRGRADHYTKENLAEVGTAIERLRARFQPKRVVVVGHSGGAATAAVLLGMKPKLIDAAVLVACPCDLVAWRAGRREWSRSENPIKWVAQVDPWTRVVALTGAKDDNTRPELARMYVEALKAHGVDAAFQLLADETHNSAFRSSEVFNAVRTLLAPK
jgi:pimeloyl-ACP methyl ester carboxylesterase